MRKLLILICIIFSFSAKASGLLDSTIWVNNFMQQVLKKQKEIGLPSFRTSTYIKNELILDKGRDKILGRIIRYDGKIKNKQLVWLNESYSKLYFNNNIGYKELIEGTKSYGKYPSWEFKSAAQLSSNFNANYVKIEALSDKSFISPLAQNAFSYYNYKVISESENDVVIAVLPKHKFSATFIGELTFNPKNYHLKHLDLKISGDKGLNFIDSLQVIQSYNQSLAHPLYTLLKYKGQVLKFYFSGTSHAVFNSKDSTKINFYKKFGKNEVAKDDSSAFHSNIVNQNRLLPLTLQERLTYQYQDSVNNKKKEKPLIDSLLNLDTRVKVFPLLFSDKVWTSKNKRRAIIFDPIVPSLFFNTVEGFGVSYGVTYLEYAQNNSNWSVTPRIRYGFSNKELNSDLSLSWYYKPKKRGAINFSIGSTYLDLNPNGSLSSLQNTLNTLFFEQNFMKLYRKEYVSLGIGRELVGNLYFSVGTEMARNYSVTNTQDYVFRDIKERNFSSNNPISPILEDKLFPIYNSFFINSSLIYTLNQPYITKDRVKIYKLPLGPRFILAYKRGIPKINNSASDYQYFEAEIQQEKLNMGLWGYGSYSLVGGKFYNVNNVYYPEWRHFSGNLALIFNPGLRSFHFLDFYTYSTNQYFFEGHFEHNFNQFFSNRVPLLRKLKLEELLGGAYLYQPNKGNYFELYTGVRRLMFRADFAVSFNNNGILNQGFRISYNF